MKFRLFIFSLAVSCSFIACMGPRNSYSSSPFVSPVRMKMGSSAIEANYFAHTIQTNKIDSMNKDRDNCFGLNVSHMPKERTLVFVSADLKKERNHFADSISSGDPSFNGYNAGFDSSIVSGKRYTAQAGIEFFSRDDKTITNSFVMSLGFHHFSMNESGLLQRLPYQRFYKVNQLSLALQQNFLVKIGKSANLAWVIRFTVLNSFKANTDYLPDEKINASLEDKKIKVFMGHIGFYIDYHPLKNIPLYFNGQFFNDLSMWNHTFAKYEVGRIYIKGTGASAGIRYIFN